MARKKNYKPNYNKGNFNGGHVSTTKQSASWIDNMKATYGANTQRLAASASIPFSTVAGIRQDLSWTAAKGSELLPSIMVLDVTPIPGFSDSNGSPLNIASRTLFAQMRKYNTSTNVYDAVDVMQYVLAMDSAYMLYSHLCRIYGILHNVNWANRFIPKALVESLGFDYTDLTVNAPLLNAVINKFGDRLQALPVADAFSFLKYHFSLFNEVYKDAEDDKAQLYVMNPKCFYVYEEGASGSEAGKLVPKKMRQNTLLLKVKDIDAFCTNLLERLTTSGSIADIAGDMLKLLQNYKMFALPVLTQDYSISPVYSEAFLEMLRNSKVVSIVDAHKFDATKNRPLSTFDSQTETYYIEQTSDVGGILCTPYIQGASIDGTIIIDTKKETVTPEELMQYTRHINVVPAGEGVRVAGKFTTSTGDTPCETIVGPMKYVGLDYFCGMHIFEYNAQKDSAIEIKPPIVPGVTSGSYFVSDLVIDGVTTGSGDLFYGMDLVTAMPFITSLLKFSSYPMIYTFNRDEWKAFSFKGILSDLTNYSFQENTILKEITETCLDSAYSLTK